MTTSAISTDVAASIVADLGGSSPSSVEMMIGIGLVKDSDAVNVINASLTGGPIEQATVSVDEPTVDATDLF